MESFDPVKALVSAATHSDAVYQLCPLTQILAECEISEGLGIHIYGGADGLLETPSAVAVNYHLLSLPNRSGKSS